MAQWIYGSYTVPVTDTPWVESEVPEDQEDEHVEFNPLGANGTDATIIQYIGTPSKGAQGSSPFVLRSWVTAATLADVRAKKRTTFTITDQLGNTHSVYLKKLVTKRWTSRDPLSIATGQTHHIWMHLLGR